MGNYLNNLFLPEYMYFKNITYIQLKYLNASHIFMSPLITCYS